MARPRTISLRSAHYEKLAARLAAERRAIGYVPESCRVYYLQAVEVLAWLEGRGITNIEKVTGDHIQAYYQYLRQRPSRNETTGGTITGHAVRQHMRVVCDLFASMVQRGELTSDPTTTLRRAEDVPSEANNERVALTQAQVEQLYNACQTAREQAMLSVLYGCGLRVGEAVRMNVADVRFGEGIVIVEHGKGGRRRTVPMSGQVAEDLRQYIASDRGWWLQLGDRQTPALIVGDRGERMQKWTYNKRLRKLGKRAGLEHKLTCHLLRHAIATHLLQRGLAMQQVQLFLGHAWLETTQTYTHVSAAMLKKLAE